jgi:predicted CoA-binding protein
MPDRASIDRFLAQRHLAVVGVSRDTKQFANQVYRHLRDGGRTLYPVNPNVASDGMLEGDRAYRSLLHVPDPVDGVLLLLPRTELRGALDDVVTRGIPRVWLHRGAGQTPIEPEIVAYCHDHSLEVVDGACPLMFDAPVKGVHRLHRFLSGRRLLA